MTSLQFSLFDILIRRTALQSRNYHHLLIGFIFAFIGNTSFAIDPGAGDYTKIEGTFQIYHPEDLWQGNLIAGLSEPLPFQLIVGHGGEFSSSYCNLTKWYKLGGNPLETGLHKKGDVFYYYSTNLAEDQKMGDIPIGLGNITESKNLPGSNRSNRSNRYVELLYIACNPAMMSTWSKDLLALDMFFGLQGRPEYKVRIKEKKEENTYEWELWASADRGGRVAEWCEYRIQVEYAPAAGNLSSYPKEIYFEIRDYDQGSTDPLGSRLWSTYKFTANTATRAISLPSSILPAESKAEQILITDVREAEDGSTKTTNYQLYKGDDIPFDANSPLVIRATTRQQNKARIQTSSAGFFFAIITIAGILLMEFHRRKKQKTS